MTGFDPAVWWPRLWLLGGTLGVLAWLALGARPAGLHRRPLVLLGTLLALTPLVVVLLGWSGVVPERWLRVQRPLMAVPVALLGCFIASRLLRLPARQSAWRRRTTELFSVVAASAAGWAAAGVELGRPLDRLAILLAVDRSRSMELVPDAEGRLRAELALAELGMKPGDRLGVVAFGATAALEDALHEQGRSSAQRAEVGRESTDLGAAIRRALAEVPADAAARIVLLTDGVNTRGDALEGAAAATAAGIPVDVVTLDQATLSDVRVVSVGVPSRASAGEPMELRVVTDATAPAEVDVRVYRDGELIRQGTAEIPAGEELLRLREPAPEPGLHRYDVEISARDQRLDQAPEDNRGTAFVRVRGESTALVLESKAELGEPLARALRDAAFLVDVKGASGVPADLAGFAAYDLITLSDIAAADLSPAQIAALASYVRDLGGGLLLMGGDRSLGPGGYGKTPLEEVSPVSFDIKQERRRATLAQVIAIDYSGSMAAQVGKVTKLDLANEAAARSADLLGAGDRLGVMHVDTVVTWTVPLGPVADKAAIAKAIRGVAVGGGGIYVDLTLREAYAALAKETVNLKHVLLFADGSDAEERSNAPRLVSDARARGITTSVVALGMGPDVPDLERMSRLGDGRFYQIEDASRLPAVFAQETILAARSSINEVTFQATPVGPGAPTRGIDFAKAPALTGYVVTLPKGRAQVLLGGPEGDPILATWSVGLGRAGAFTSDYKDRWGQGWTTWAGAARLFGQLGRDLCRQADDPRLRLEASTGGGALHLRATLVDAAGRAENFRRLRARVAGPDGFMRDVALEVVGSGAYAAELPLDTPGSYLATVVDELSSEPLGTTGASLGMGEELRPTGANRALLARISALSGGVVRDTLAGLFHQRDARRFAYQSLSSPLLVVAALALLASVAARRVSWPERRVAAAGTSAEPEGASPRRDRLLALLRARRAPGVEAAAPGAAGVPTGPGVPGAPTGRAPGGGTAGGSTPPGGGVAAPPGSTAAALLSARQRQRAGADPVAPVELPPPSSAPRFATGARSTRPAATPGAPRTETAAEILARRRRERRG